MSRKSAIYLGGSLLLAVLTFVLGMVTVRDDLWVYRAFLQIDHLVESLRATGHNLPATSYARRPAHAPDRPYVVYSTAAVAPGYLALTRLDPERGRYVLDVLAEDGSVVHTWVLDRSKIIEGGSPWDLPHATRVFADGTVLVGFASHEAGLARLDACGEPMWVRPTGVYHHAISPDPEGGYWTWRSVAWAESQDQEMLHFSEDDGRDLEVIDLVDDVIARFPDVALRFAVPEGFTFMRGDTIESAQDAFHPNDVEPLPAAYAEAFPQFHPGDLLISLRNLDMVAVLDRETFALLWARQGPWRQQHDPDWQPDGTISVFNNARRGQVSDLLAVDPKTDAVTAVLGPGGPRFYTPIMGNQERLPNGNWLVLSSQEGRVLEVGASGMPVREYNNIVNAEYNAVVSNVEYLPAGFLAGVPSCAGR